MEVVFGRGMRVRRKIEKLEWTVVDGYGVGYVGRLFVSSVRDIVLPSDRGGGASLIKQ